MNKMPASQYLRVTKKRSSPEHDEQVKLMKRVAMNLDVYPILDLLFAIPNGGQRNIITASKLKAEGVKAGVPDLMLPVAREFDINRMLAQTDWYHGLFIEMKANKNTPSAKQKEWISNLRDQGYRVEVCYSVDEAWDVLVEYIKS